MKHQHDSKYRPVKFDVGDWVWLLLQQRLAASLAANGNAKLSPRYFGPYKVLECIGEVVYRLQLPPHARIHDVFHVVFLKKYHVVFLKKYHGPPPDAPPPLSDLLHGRVVPIPQVVVRTRIFRDIPSVGPVAQGAAMSEASWLPLEEFQRRYPEFHLEDELFHQPGGSVRDEYWGHHYNRRSKAKEPSIKT
jgi:hypothetical protein